MRSLLKRSVTSIAGLCCALGLCLGAGCSQDEGQECQLASDCSGDLVCDRAKLAERGVCRDPKKLNTSSDAGAQLDAAEPPLPDTDSGVSPAEDGGLDLPNPAGQGDAG
jgi:hypothetical protein